MNARLPVVALAVAASACGLVPPGPDGGLVTVPEQYRLAKAAPGHETHLRLTGDEQVRCRDCHAVADAGFTTPPADLCVACHAEQTRQHHPLDAGAELTCLTCHPFMAKTLPQRFERWSCLECHREPQGAHPAVTVHRSECQACHRPHEAPFTLAAECSDCHQVRFSHGAKGDTLAERCMNCHQHHEEGAQASAMCVTCHLKPAMPARARVAKEALFRPGHPGCGSCHQAHQFDKQVVKPCVACHAQTPVLAPLEHDTCVDCHQPHAPRAGPVACASCHRSEVVKHPKPKTGEPCAGCHPPHEASLTSAVAVPCVACHDQPPFTAPVVHAAKVECLDCHDAHDGAPTTQRECRSCHDTRFVEVARIKDPKGHRDCAGCHLNLPHGLEGQKACTACHTKQTPPQAGHPECKGCHESHSGAVTKTCAQCHQPSTLPALHAVKEHQQCERCHAPHAPEPGSGPATCQGCHKALAREHHPTPPRQCATCHLFQSARPGRDGGR